jgi:hypothetical protein
MLQSGIGKGPMLAIIDGFTGPAQVRALPFVSTPTLPLRLADVILSRQWYGFAEGADRIVMDQHPCVLSLGWNLYGD